MPCPASPHANTLLSLEGEGIITSVASMKEMSPTCLPGVHVSAGGRGRQLQPKLTLPCLSAVPSSPKGGDLGHSLI